MQRLLDKRRGYTGYGLCAPWCAGEIESVDTHGLCQSLPGELLSLGCRGLEFPFAFDDQINTLAALGLAVIGIEQEAYLA